MYEYVNYVCRKLDMPKSWNRIKNESRMEWLNFIEKVYYTIVADTIVIITRTCPILIVCDDAFEA